MNLAVLSPRGAGRSVLLQAISSLSCASVTLHNADSRNLPRGHDFSIRNNNIIVKSDIIGGCFSGYNFRFVAIFPFYRQTADILNNRTLLTIDIFCYYGTCA